MVHHFISGGMSSQGTPSVNRRELLAGLTAATSMGLAGCNFGGGNGGGNGGGEGDQSLGERVPQLTIDFFATLGKINEDYAQGSMQDLEEGLDLNIEASGREHTALVNDLYADKRRSLLPLYIFALEPDPYFSTLRLQADQAGTGIGTAGQNTSQWVNCDYSVRAEMQGTATSTEERRRLVNEAWSIASHDLVTIPISTRAYITGFRTDQITPDDDIWPVDYAPHLFQSFFKISPGSNDTIVAEGTGTMFEVPGNPFLYTSQQHLANTLVRSPLLMYNKAEGYEITNNLASTIEREDSGKKVTIELKETQFHNGDPVTAEDVKFTYDYGIAGARAGQHQFAPTIPSLEQIVEVDERTVRFEMNESYAPLVDREFPTWGIFHKDSWMQVLSEKHGVDSFDSHESSFEGFGEVEMNVDNITGCGPYEMVDFVTSESISLVRAGDHPVHDPKCDIEFVNRRDAASRLSSLQAGDINVATLAPSQVGQVEDNPDITTVSMPRIQHWAFFTPNCAAAPTKFKEFRQAVAMTLNRQEMVQVSQRGMVEPEMYSTIYSSSHPWRPPEDMLYKMADDPTGNPEQARQILTDAGWGWDDGGNLRYPADADTSPLFPAESTPNPDDYPCLTEEGYTRPEGYELSRDQVPGYDD